MTDTKLPQHIQASESERTQVLERFYVIRSFLEDGVILAQIVRKQAIPGRIFTHRVKQYRETGLSGLVRQERADKGERRNMPDSLEQLDLLLLQEAKGRRVYQDGIQQQLKKEIYMSPVSHSIDDNRWWNAGQTATYIICTNPRSGSWLLSQGLASTLVAGNPREWFHTLEEQQYRARWYMEHSIDLSYSKYLKLARAESMNSNGVSGIKLHYYQFAELSKKMAAIEGFRGLTAAQVMLKAFPNAKYIWLTRRDKLRQAISFLLASSTGAWWSIEDSPANTRSESMGDAEFDPHAIARMEHVFKENDLLWQSYFQTNGIAPLVIYYEDFAADYADTIVSILRWLGISNTETIVVPPPRLRRQSNTRNEEWLARYTAFQREGGHLVQTPASDGTRGHLSERIEKISETIPDVWKQWVGQCKLLHMKDEAIVEGLIANGYSRASALAEVEKATSDPYLLAGIRIQQRLQKGGALLNALGQLVHLDSGSKTIERISNLSRAAFRDRYYAANRPVILTGLMADWKAMTAWTLEYLKSIAGDQIVEIMTGRGEDPQDEMNVRMHQKALRFADYIDMVSSGKVPNDNYLVANYTFFQRPEMQPLLKDFTAFPEYLNQTDLSKQCSLWFVPAGTVMPLHHETGNMLMAQVAGRQRYQLIPSSQWQYVYNNKGAFSDVDCENPDLDRYPKFGNATIIDVVVEPGEVLFLPVGWWHHVRALDVSMTVLFTNFVFPNHFSWE